MLTTILRLGVFFIFGLLGYGTLIVPDAKPECLHGARYYLIFLPLVLGIFETIALSSRYQNGKWRTATPLLSL